MAGESAKKLRLLIVDDHNLVRNGLKAILSSFPEIQSIDEANNGEEAVKKAIALKPDLILMDIQMPKMDGLEALKAIKKVLPQTKIVMLTIINEEDIVSEAIKLGANGYLVKNSTKEELQKVINKVAEGSTYVSPEMAMGLIKSLVDVKTQPVKKQLTPREIQILQLMAEGKTNKEIAHALNLSEQTVKTHAKKIFRKMEVADRAQAVAEGLRKHLVK